MLVVSPLELLLLLGELLLLREDEVLLGLRLLSSALCLSAPLAGTGTAEVSFEAAAGACAATLSPAFEHVLFQGHVKTMFDA